ncbi:hypothetical protein ACEPPN_005881 [Leptodophora sp. 'Broadleaf-Isolate-01']
MAQEVAEAEATADIGLPVPKPLNMAKFALKAYYRKRGQRLADLCLYEYSAQIFVRTFAGAAGRAMCFLFEETHPQHMTQV